MSEQEKERQALASFCSIMGMPPPSRKNSWMVRKDGICSTSSELINADFKNWKTTDKEKLKRKSKTFSNQRKKVARFQQDVDYVAGQG